MEKIEVKNSSIEGKGVFASENIKKGELICIMRGKRKSMKSFERDFKSGDKRAGADPLQIGVKQYVSLDNPYNYINHSCDPNAGIKGARKLIAVKDIMKGTEITYDYSSVEWTPKEYPPYYGDCWPLKCNCGSKICRGLACCFGYLPKEIQEKYIKEGVIPNHIIKKLSMPKEEQKCLVCEEKLKQKSGSCPNGRIA